MSGKTINLHGTWKLRCGARGIEIDYQVPGDVHSALIAAGQIPDPYKGVNELACRWVADEEWVAEREFEWSGKGRCDLLTDYIDTIADIKINGKTVIRARNCFREHTAEVSKCLKRGKNRIAIHFASNTKEANKSQAAQPYFVPYIHWNSPIPNGNMLRKPASHFGWDWNLAVAPFGACGALRLMLDEGPFIFVEKVLQKHLTGGDVRIEVYYAIWWNDMRPRDVAHTVSFAGQVKALKNTKRGLLKAAFVLKSPDLWWPNGAGVQHLHEVQINCDGATATRRIGLRTIDLVSKKDKAGRSFGFRVNGRDIFCKGANWIPADALPSRATPELTRKLLQAAVDANMNMIRVWGGGYYEQDWFYDICDELGIMVWQDFMFSCNLYPATEVFLREVEAEVRYQVRRLSHHACIALWCGDNELIGALNWFPESKKNRDRYLAAYDRLNHTIERAAKETDPTISWWPSSPSPGPMDFGDAWHDDSKGDMHFWSVWHEGKDFEHYYDVKPRFCSEFGFQSFPSLRICKEFVESEEDLNISSAVMEHHQRNKGGNARIAETMFRYFRFPKDFGNFVYLSQIQQGLAMKMAIEYWRSLKPHCMGTLYWQLNDTWPVASWSGLDHGGSWKLLHYMARRFYAPVLVTARRAGDEFIISAVHDLAKDHTTEIDIQLINMDGAAKPLFKKKFKIKSDGQEITRLDRHKLIDGILLVRWTDESGIARRSHATAVPYKHLALPKPGLSISVTAKSGALDIKISAKALALYVSLECDVAGHFSDNAFDLLGGENVTISFTPDNPAELQRAEDTLQIRDLYSSSH